MSATPSVYIGPFLYVKGLPADQAPTSLRTACWGAPTETPDKVGSIWLPHQLPEMGRMLDAGARNALVLDGRVMAHANAQLFQDLTPVIRDLQAMKGVDPVVMYGVIPLSGR